MSQEAEARIVLDGERLYVFPYSVDRGIPYQKRSVFYLSGSSQAPYANEDILNWETANYGWYFPLWKRFIYAVVGRMLVALWRAFLNRSWFSNEFHTAVPFVATDYPAWRFGLKKQLMISEGQWYNFDSVYVVPSQKWLREQVDARLDRNSGDYPEHWEEDVIAFRKWKQVQEGLDREVCYLVSLDT